MDTSWIVLGGVVVFFGAVLVYVLLMIFFPEWVGITGKTARDAERSHAEERVTHSPSEKTEPSKDHV